MNSNSNNNTAPVFPGVIVNNPTPSEDGNPRFLPPVTPRRNVLQGGRPEQQQVKPEFVYDSCNSGVDAHSNSQRWMAHQSIRHGGRWSGIPVGNAQFLRAPNQLIPMSPTFSDISSVRLTPKSPGHGPIFVPTIQDAFKSPEGSRKNSTTREVDESVVMPLYPPVQSYSPYLSSPLLSISPQALLPRKRGAISVSPFPDVVDLSSIRASPNSLAAMSGQSPLRPGSIGHLIGRLSPSLSPAACIQYQIQNRRTSVEHVQGRDGNTVTITNQVTLAPAPIQHAITVSSSALNYTRMQPWNQSGSLSNMVFTGGDRSEGVQSPGSQESAILAQMDPEGHSFQAFFCKWKDCGLVLEDQEELVRHIEKVHVEPKKTQEDYVCLWEKCVRGQKPFNARYKLLIHMRTHSGEKPNKCTVSFIRNK